MKTKGFVLSVLFFSGCFSVPESEPTDPPTGTDNNSFSRIAVLSLADGWGSTETIIRPDGREVFNGRHEPNLLYPINKARSFGIGRVFHSTVAATALFPTGEAGLEWLTRRIVPRPPPGVISLELFNRRLPPMRLRFFLVVDVNVVKEVEVGQYRTLSFITDERAGATDDINADSTTWQIGNTDTTSSKSAVRSYTAEQEIASVTVVYDYGEDVPFERRWLIYLNQGPTNEDLDDFSFETYDDFFGDLIFFVNAAVEYVADFTTIGLNPNTGTYPQTRLIFEDWRESFRKGLEGDPDRRFEDTELATFFFNYGYARLEDFDRLRGIATAKR